MKGSGYQGTPCCAAQERIRALHRELLLQSCGVFESQRVCEFLVLGLASKNNRTRIEAIEVRFCTATAAVCINNLCRLISGDLPTGETATCCATVHEFPAAESSWVIAAPGCGDGLPASNPCTHCASHVQVLGELIGQEGIIVYQGARYKPLPAVAQVSGACSVS